MPELRTIVNGESAASRQAPEPLHFVGHVACPFKPTFKEHMDEVLEAHRKRTGVRLRVHIPMGCGDYDEYDNLWKAESIEEFPDVVASVGFGDFFRTAFVERFVKKGYFRSAWSGPVQEPFETAGFRDPNGWYTIYSVWPYVMLIDKKRLGGRPMPRRWSDLLDACYRQDIITNGSQDNRVAEVPLLYFHKDHGEAGLVRLAANIRDFWHPAEMVKAAGASGGNGAAVYIIPSFFALARHRPDETPVVWPEDGALTSPVYLLAKTARRPETDVVVRALVGRELGDKSSRAFFPSLNPAVNNRLPAGATFKWLGWNYLRVQDSEKLKRRATDIFLDAWDRNGNGRAS